MYVCLWFMADQFYTIDIRRALFEIHGFIFTIEMQGCTDRTSQLVKVLVEVSHCKKKKKIPVQIPKYL